MCRVAWLLLTSRLIQTAIAVAIHSDKYHSFDICRKCKLLHF
ncbi:hypothetical protein FDUTEX481_08750 [Tolypothrix sp. PCC 7601]|nr:hypothetical protein FDUTEX481_08750 [Tolypothrix sp. PCC 7601]